MRYFGCHVSTSGGLARAIENAEALGINTIQIHACPPQRWNTKAFPVGIEGEFVAARSQSRVAKLFFHGIYLINLASLDERIYPLSQKSLIYGLDLISRMEGEGIIFHLGSNKDHDDEAVGLSRAADAINRILEQAPSGRLILECAAGSGKIIGDKLEELAFVYERIKQKERVGFGLDSQHMWASGYDLREDLEGVIKQVESILGMDKVWSVHLNDSKTELGSKKDRHENIGDGLIGYEALKHFFCHPKLREIPFILETPAMATLDDAAKEVQKLHTMLEGN